MGADFLEGLFKSASMILVSEIGDKTFFVAALLAMRHPRRWVLLGSLSALWVMTLLSALFGWAVPNVVPRHMTHALATLLFLVFGLRSLWDGLMSKEDRASEELREVEEELNAAIGDRAGAKKGVAEKGKGKGKGGSKKHQHQHQHHHAHGHSGQSPGPTKSHGMRLDRFVSPVALQAFSMVFLGEWGDKSQIATVGLAAEESVWGVALGGCLGHAVCSGAAVLGGRHLATQISEKMVSICAGALFLAFGLHSFLHGPDAAAL